MKESEQQQQQASIDRQQLLTEQQRLAEDKAAFAAWRQQREAHLLGLQERLKRLQSLAAGEQQLETDRTILKAEWQQVASERSQLAAQWEQLAAEREQCTTAYAQLALEQQQQLGTQQLPAMTNFVIADLKSEGVGKRVWQQQQAQRLHGLVGCLWFVVGVLAIVAALYCMCLP